MPQNDRDDRRRCSRETEQYRTTHEGKKPNCLPQVAERLGAVVLHEAKSRKGDRLGNLVYRDTARNFNPLAAMAGRVTIAEVEELVDVGQLDPNHIHTPGIFVQRILEGSAYEKRIERRTVRER